MKRKKPYPSVLRKKNEGLNARFVSSTAQLDSSKLNFGLIMIFSFKKWLKLNLFNCVNLITLSLFLVEYSPLGGKLINIFATIHFTRLCGTVRNMKHTSGMLRFRLSKHYWWSTSCGYDFGKPHVLQLDSHFDSVCLAWHPSLSLIFPIRALSTDSYSCLIPILLEYSKVRGFILI